MLNNIRTTLDGLFSNARSTAERVETLPFSTIIGGPIGVTIVSAATYQAATNYADILKKDGEEAAELAARAGAIDVVTQLHRFVPGADIVFTDEERELLATTIVDAIKEKQVIRVPRETAKILRGKKEELKYEISKDGFGKAVSSGVVALAKGVARSTNNSALEKLANNKQIQQTWANLGKDTFAMFSGDFSMTHTTGFFRDVKKLQDQVKAIPELASQASDQFRHFGGNVQAAATSMLVQLKEGSNRFNPRNLLNRNGGQHNKGE